MKNSTAAIALTGLVIGLAFSSSRLTGVDAQSAQSPAPVSADAAKQPGKKDPAKPP